MPLTHLLVDFNPSLITLTRYRLLHQTNNHHQQAHRLSALSDHLVLLVHRNHQNHQHHQSHHHLSLSLRQKRKSMMMMSITSPHSRASTSRLLMRSEWQQKKIHLLISLRRSFQSPMSTRNIWVLSMKRHQRQRSSQRSTQRNSQKK